MNNPPPGKIEAFRKELSELGPEGVAKKLSHAVWADDSWKTKEAEDYLMQVEINQEPKNIHIPPNDND